MSFVRISEGKAIILIQTFAKSIAFSQTRLLSSRFEQEYDRMAMHIYDKIQCSNHGLDWDCDGNATD